MLFSGTSSQEGGTLFQLRNLINRRNVVMKVKTDMNATEDFFEVITAGHIVAVTLHTCGMTNLEDTLLTSTLMNCPHIRSGYS